MVTNYKGISLWKYIYKKKNLFNKNIVDQFILNISTALTNLERIHLVHGDITPDNVLYD